MGEGLRLKARWRVAKATLRTVVWVVVGLLLAVLFLLRTGLGHEVVLGWGVGQLRARVAGAVEVDAIRSANLLRGARLVGVRLMTPDGDPFVEVDSLEVSYALGGLARGVLSFDNIRIWRPRVTLVRDSTGRNTFDRWLRGDAVGTEVGSDRVSVLLEAIRIDEGAFALRLASEGDPDGPFRTEVGPDGRARRALDLRGIETQISRVEVSPSVGIEVDVDRVEGELDLLRRRFEVSDVRAEVRIHDGKVSADLRRFSVPGIAGAGTVLVDLEGPQGAVTDIEATFDRADLTEWGWVTAGVPPLRGSLDLRGHLEPGTQQWTASDVDARWLEGRIRGRATAILRDGPTAFDDVALTVTALPLTALEPYLAEPPPVPGSLDGRLALSGPADRLRVEGALTLTTDAGSPVTAVFQGGVQRRDHEVGFEDFEATLDPLDYAVLGRFVPAVELTGPGRVQIEATGSLHEGLAVRADLEHSPPGLAPTHLLVSGNVFATAADDRIRVDVQGDFSPLSFDALASDYAVPLRGTLTGPVRARGVLRDLEVRARLATGTGSLDLTGRFDVRDRTGPYRIDATVTDLPVSSLSPSLPDPTSVSGHIELEGRGFDPATLVAEGVVDLSRAVVGGVRVDSTRVEARIADGVLTVDSLQSAVVGMRLQGRGTLAVDTTLPAGQLRVAFEGDDLRGVRAVFRGDTVLTADDLTPLDRDVLELRGVDPDTLPLAVEVAAEGTVRGEVALEGSVSRFSATGWMEGERLVYGRSTLRSGRVDLDVEGLPGLAGSVHAEVRLDSAVVADRTFTEGSVSLDFNRPEGRAVVALARDSTEDYRLTGRFQLDSLGGVVDLEEVTMRIDSLRYRTTHPTRLAWTESVFAIDSLEIVGAGADSVRIRAQGTLPRRGVADFDLDIEGLVLQRLTRILEREDLELGGTIDFSGTVRGTASHPEVSGHLVASDLTARDISLERVEGSVVYSDLDLGVDLGAWVRDTQVFRVEGDWPMSLTLDGSRRDVSERSVALRVRADSLPSGLVLALLEDLEDTRGTITGEIEVGGTPSRLEPRGQLRLRGGAWTVGALGVRQEQVEATFDVAPDRVVQVSATGRSGGSVDVTGTVTLDSLASPALDLDIVLSSFNAVDRRDLAGAVSGDLELQGRYGQPRVLGSLQVERGDLYLDEFARNVGVIDLSDPRFFAFINEDLLAGRPLLADTRNPFMDNLLVNIDLAVQRNTWLRSDQLDVEMRGDLIVTYDRRSRDVVLVGELQAVRGEYRLGSQNFEVEGGSVEFVGIPGINPDLAIEAVAHVRRRQADEPLEITAQLEGTLIEPRVSLTTADAAVSESDILSYLAIGQPASAFTSGGVNQAGLALVGGGVSFVGGTLASSLSSLAQSSGWIDFVSISQAIDASALGAGASSFAGTQVELGRYFGGGDYFAALMFRPLYRAGSTGTLLGGARLEWQASEQYQVEVFAEDRFLRTGSFGFRDFGVESKLIYGFSLFREWGY